MGDEVGEAVLESLAVLVGGVLGEAGGSLHVSSCLQRFFGRDEEGVG